MTHSVGSGAASREVLLKHTVRTLLAERRLDEVAEIVARHRRVFGTLVSLTYDADPQIAWRAVDAMGSAAARVADADPARVRDYLRRLMWLMTEECGGICWRAPEAMAQIVASCPEPSADYVPIVAHLILETAEEDLEHFRPGMLWALGRLGPLAADAVEDVLPAVTAALDHEDAQVRGMAVWCLGRLGRGETVAGRAALQADTGSVTLYEDGALGRTTVARLAEAALSGVTGPR